MRGGGGGKRGMWNVECGEIQMAFGQVASGKWVA